MHLFHGPCLIRDALCHKCLPAGVPLHRAGGGTCSPLEPCPSTTAGACRLIRLSQQQGRAGTDLGPIKDALCNRFLRQVPWEGC